MKELMIVKEISPVIEINFEEVKQSMTEVLEKYKGYIVTEDNLSVCKSTQKELAGLRIKIDGYRKDKKKELSEPIVTFENQCKELVSLVESAEVPIKQGIQVFDDKKREEKKEFATRTMYELVVSKGLEPKFASKLTVIDKYMNLTATEKDVREDLEQRAEAILTEQKNAQAIIEVIQVSIENANTGINAKLSIEDFKRSIDNGVSAKDIIADINARAERIRVSEMPKVEEVKEIIPAEEVANHFETPVASFETPTVKNFVFEVRITATESQLRALKQFLLIQNIAYEKISLEEV